MTPRQGYRRLLLTVGRAVFLLAALGLLAWQVSRDAGGAADAFRSIGVGNALAALVAACVGLGLSGVAWRSVLAALGSPLPVSAIPPVFFVAQVGKYLPGSVWPYLAQVRLGRDHGIPASRSAAASVLFVIAHCATGATVAVAVLPWAAPDAARRFWWMLALTPLLLLVLQPRVVLPLLRHTHRVVGKGVAPEAIHGRHMLAALSWLLGTWVCYGVSLLLLVWPLTTAGPARTATVAFGGYALAWTVGFAAAAVLVVAAPAGLGFREVVLVAVLGPILPAGAATAVIVLSRVIHTLGDGLWAGLGALAGSRHRAGQPSGSRSADPAGATGGAAAVSVVDGKAGVTRSG